MLGGRAGVISGVVSSRGGHKSQQNPDHGSVCGVSAHLKVAALGVKGTRICISGFQRVPALAVNTNGVVGRVEAGAGRHEPQGSANPRRRLLGKDGSKGKAVGGSGVDQEGGGEKESTGGRHVANGGVKESWGGGGAGWWGGLGVVVSIMLES